MNVGKCLGWIHTLRVEHVDCTYGRESMMAVSLVLFEIVCCRFYDLCASLLGMFNG